MILCSVGAVIGRGNDWDIRHLYECLDRLNCDGYEFMLFGMWYEQIDALKRFMRDFPAPVPVFHCEKRVGDLISRNDAGDYDTAVERFEINCALARDIGAEKLVLHLWGGLASDKEIERNIAAYAVLRDILDRYGLELCVENVVCNTRDPMTHMRTLAGIYPDISFTYDTKMAEFHGQLGELSAPENQWLLKHIRHLHINDYKGAYGDWDSLRTLHVGDGQADFDGFFKALNATDYRGHYTVEATSIAPTGEIDFAALNRSFDRIRSYIE